MIKKDLPSISIIIATFNSARTLRLCLKKVKEQDYPKNKIEIITADGGSKDITLEIARKYGAKIVNIDPDKQNAEYNKGIGLQNAKNDIALFLDHDNIMPHKKWLRKLINPFVEDPEIIGSEPLRFYYDPKMTVLDRYFALFGGSDPVVYYLGKNSHLSWMNKQYNLLGRAIDMGEYYKVTYQKNKIPALGGNGAALKRRELLLYAKTSPDQFVHTDVVADLIRGGHNKYALINDSIMHLTNNKVFSFLKRRKYFIEKYQLQNEYKRRYHIYEPNKDRTKLLKYIFLSLTFIVPFWDALKGFYRIRDLAWFLHPLMCFAFVVIYTIPVLKGGIRYVILGR